MLDARAISPRSGSLDPQHQEVMQITILASLVECSYTPNFRDKRNIVTAQYSTNLLQVLVARIMANKCLPS
jgi:hypothetical protein